MIGNDYHSGQEEPNFATYEDKFNESIPGIEEEIKTPGLITQIGKVGGNMKGRTQQFKPTPGGGLLPIEAGIVTPDHNDRGFIPPTARRGPNTDELLYKNVKRIQQIQHMGSPRGKFESEDELGEF